VKLFRLISLAEGVSWLLLFFIAMPLKYGAGWPLAVFVMGRVHGALFVLFIFTLGRAAVEAEWGLRQVARAFLASLVPFGAFWLERRFREEERAASVKA
jgi:integral membrane protein